MLGIWGIFIFGNRHIKNFYLLSNGKEVAIETYANFGLSMNKEKVMPVSYLKGNRVFFSRKLNVFQLEYTKTGKWKKYRSLFYRPEFIADPELWKLVRNGNEIMT
jgi:hypothetical protein